MELNTVQPMIYAFKKGSSDWSKHDIYGVWSLALARDGVLTDGGLNSAEMLRNSDYEQHGLFMWSAWFVVGLSLLVTKRYLKRFWKPMHFVHALLGYYVLIVTVVFALKLTEWEPTKTLHNGLGTAMLFVTIVGALSGSLTAGTMSLYNGDKPWSKKERVERIAKIHRYAGYLMLLLGNVTVFTGISHYYNDIMLGDSRKALGPLSLICFVLLVAIFEAIFRIRNRWSLGQVTPSEAQKMLTFKPSEIDAAVEAGK